MHDTGGLTSSGDTSSHTSHTSYQSDTWVPTGPQYVIQNPDASTIGQLRAMLGGRWIIVAASVLAVIVLAVLPVLYALRVI
jgi:hypothetical protein